MIFDLMTMSVASAVVIATAATMFIIDTVLWKDDRSGRIWSIGFLAGVLTSVSYLVAAGVPDLWWTIAVGNGSFVLAVACLWTGCRVYNGRRALLWVVAVGPLLAGLLVVVEGPDGGPWAGAVGELGAVAVYASAAGVESLRGRMGANPFARPLAATFLAASLFYAMRTIVFVLAGHESSVFQAYLGSVQAHFVTIILVVIAAMSMSVLRLDPELPGRGTLRTSLTYTSPGVLENASFQWSAIDWLERAAHHDEQMALLHVRIDSLDDISSAFGRGMSAQLIEHWVEAVRRHSPPHADVGDDGVGRLAIITPVANIPAAQKVADAIHAGLIEEPSSYGSSMRLTASIGVALTDLVGYDYDTLLDQARTLSREASDAGGARALLGR